MKVIRSAAFFFIALAAVFIIDLSSGQPESGPSGAVILASPDETGNSVSEIVAYPGEVIPETTASPVKLYPFPGKGIPVLMYHSISSVESNSLCVTREQFIEELEWLRDNNYHTLSIEEFSGAFNGESIPENPILITFDDGYMDNYTSAQPILEKYGMRATYFIITGCVGAAGYLDWDQLREILGAGGSVGSHTAGHYDLRTLSDARQEKELRESKKTLEERLGINVIAFCYPSGRFNYTTETLLSDIGYTLAFTTKSGRARQNDNKYELRRVRVWNGMPLKSFIKQVSY